MPFFRPFLWLLLTLSVTVSSCKDDDEDDVVTDPPPTYTATSTPNFRLNMGDGSLLVTAGVDGWQSFSENNHSIGQTSTLRYGAVIRHDSGQQLRVEFGPYYYNFLPDQSVFYTYLQNGEKQVGTGEGNVRLSYVDSEGNAHSTANHAQVGSSFNVVDTQHEGDYIRFYATYSVIMMDETSATGHIVGRIYRY